MQINIVKNGLTQKRFGINAVPAVYFTKRRTVYQYEGSWNAEAVRPSWTSLT